MMVEGSFYSTLYFGLASDGSLFGIRALQEYYGTGGIGYTYTVRQQKRAKSSIAWDSIALFSGAKKITNIITMILRGCLVVTKFC